MENYSKLTVQYSKVVKTLPKGALVEIEVVAAV